MDQELIKKKHHVIFGDVPEIVVYAPGRVNLIGEHTDYSEGFVLPVAINMGITLAASKFADSNMISAYSMDYDKKMGALYDDLMKSQDQWFNYPVGIIKVLNKRGYKFGGVRLTITGNIPQGAGLSSSAALEIGIAFAIQKLYNLKISGPDLAKICQEAEHDFVGVNCGIMDQFVSRMAETNAALFLDCRSLAYENIPMKLGSAKLVMTNSNVPRKLSSSKYNERVFECNEAVKIFQSNEGIQTLRDVSMELFEKEKDFLPDLIRKRAFHVISENERVLKAKEVLKAGNLEELGKLLIESHKSLRDNFEVSSPELDWLVDTAIKVPGCYGARLVGAGFGGCTLALMKESAIPEYKKKLEAYESQFGLRAVVYESLPMEGVHLL